MDEEERDYVVEEGDCLSQIAFESGFFWDTLWNHPANAALKEERRSPFVLNPGDTVHIPARRSKSVAVETGKVHRFRRRGVPAKLRVRVYSGDRPIAGEPYRLEVDGTVLTGTTGEDGLVEAFVAPNAGKALLTVGSGEEQRVYGLALRRLDPESAGKGLQERLRNLGYYTGEVNGELDERTRLAIRAFQKAQELEPDGEDTPRLRERLRTAHGC
jgi:hypothetical protein